MYLSYNFLANGLIHEFMWQLGISRQAEVISSVNSKKWKQLWITPWEWFILQKMDEFLKYNIEWKKLDKGVYLHKGQNRQNWTLVLKVKIQVGCRQSPCLEGVWRDSGVSDKAFFLIWLPVT